jgi:hypothetical protein
MESSGDNNAELIRQRQAEAVAYFHYHMRWCINELNHIGYQNLLLRQENYLLRCEVIRLRGGSAAPPTPPVSKGVTHSDRI